MTEQAKRWAIFGVTFGGLMLFMVGVAIGLTMQRPDDLTDAFNEQEAILRTVEQQRDNAELMAAQLIDQLGTIMQQRDEARMWVVTKADKLDACLHDQMTR